MKNLITWLAVTACMAFATTAVAGGNTTTLKAEKICAQGIDIFNMESMEQILGLPEGTKLADYLVVLSKPEGVWKYNLKYSGDFKSLMNKVKEQAVAGALFFVDEGVTAAGAKVPQAAFYLR